jgi:hypothetical protein
MKKIIFLSLFAIISLTAWADTATDTTTYRYSIICNFVPDSFYFSPMSSPNYYHEKDSTIYYSKKKPRFVYTIDRSDSYMLVDSGQPAIPLLDITFLAPPNCYYKGCEYEIIERNLFAKNYKFPPGLLTSRTSVPASVNSKGYTTRTEYFGRDFSYPDSIYKESIETVWPYKNRFYHEGVFNIKELFVSPFYFDAIKKEVYISKMKIIILYGKNSDATDVMSPSVYTQYDNIFKGMIYNYNDYKSLYSNKISGIISPYAAAMASSIIACSEGGVRCQIGSEVKKATLTFCTISGQTVSQMEVGSRGEVVVVPSTSEWQPGTYLCILRTDGQKADAKKFVIR